MGRGVDRKTLTLVLAVAVSAARAFLVSPPAWVPPVFGSFWVVFGFVVLWDGLREAEALLRSFSPRLLSEALSHFGLFLFVCGSALSFLSGEALLLTVLQYSGIVLLAFGACAMALSQFGLGRRAILSVAGLFAVFIFIVLAGMGVGRHPLNPVLKSGWLVPHIAAYISGYALMAFSLFTIRKKTDFTRRVVRLGWAFLTLGLCLGALWAHSAWGAFWAWDPKETWALASWLLYLLYLHMPQGRRSVWLLILAFAVLQMCWWGVNLLPGADSSLHLY